MVSVIVYKIKKYHRGVHLHDSIDNDTTMTLVCWWLK